MHTHGGYEQSGFIKLHYMSAFIWDERYYYCMGMRIQEEILSGLDLRISHHMNKTEISSKNVSQRVSFQKAEFAWEVNLIK